MNGDFESKLALRRSDPSPVVSATGSTLVARGRYDAAAIMAHRETGPKPVPLAESKVLRLAQEGNPIAQFDLGRVLSEDWFLATGALTHTRQVGSTGENVIIEGPGNDGEAASWLRRSADQNYAPAQFFLGLAYADGEENSVWFNANKNLVEAAKWFRRAADQGDAAAAWYLGDMYIRGEVVTKNLEQAINWYRKSADGGNSTGRSKLINALFEMGKTAVNPRPLKDG